MGNNASADVNGTTNLSVSPFREKLGVARQHSAQHRPGKDAVHQRLVQLFQYLASDEDGEFTDIPKERFIQYFACCHKEFGEVLWGHYQRGIKRSVSHDFLSTYTALSTDDKPCANGVASTTRTSQLVSTESTFLGRRKFVNVSQDILGLHNGSQKARYFLQVFSQGTDSLNRQDLDKLVYACYVCSVWTSGESQAASKNACRPYIDAVVTSMVKNADSVTVDSLVSWLKKNCPNMTYGLAKWVNDRLITTAQPAADIGRGFYPDDSCKTDQLLQPIMECLLHGSLPDLYNHVPTRPTPMKRVLSGEISTREFLNKLMLDQNHNIHWTKLYNSDEHGLSINRLEHHVFSYKGPTVMLIAGEDDILVTLAVDQEWRLGTTRWGDKNGVALQITPEFRVLGSGSRLYYLNLSSRGHPFGLQVLTGGKTPEVQIDRDLTILYVKNHACKLKKIEVYGCAGEETRKDQMKQKKWENIQAQKCREVNINCTSWEENPDRFLLELASAPSRQDYL